MSRSWSLWYKGSLFRVKKMTGRFVILCKVLTHICMYIFSLVQRLASERSGWAVTLFVTSSVNIFTNKCCITHSAFRSVFTVYLAVSSATIKLVIYSKYHYTTSHSAADKPSKSVYSPYTIIINHTSQNFDCQ